MEYFWLICKHKWFVFRAGLKIKCSLWQLIWHDWTKFLPCELPHYQRQFFGKADDALGFITCWIHHQNSNKHHWEYWIPRTGHNRCTPPYLNNVPIPMPKRYILEMIADWFGACRAYEGHYPNMKHWIWFDKNFDNMKLHSQTREDICHFLLTLGYEKSTSVTTV